MGWSIISPLRDRLAESPMWHPAEQALYWTDWYGPTIHRKRWGQDKVESWTIPGETVLGCFVFASGGRLLLERLVLPQQAVGHRGQRRIVKQIDQRRDVVAAEHGAQQFDCPGRRQNR